MESFLAPMHEYTDLPFRLLCQKHGAGAACVPLISADAIARDPEKVSLIDAHPHEAGVGVQLVGRDPKSLGSAAAAVCERMPFVRWVNLNCGCPSARTRGCGGGSALMHRPEIIAQAVDEMKSSCGRPVSVKMRILERLPDTLALCRRIEDAGADSIIIHARTIAQGYSGKADWAVVKAVKEAAGIAIVGNGDIRSMSEGRGLVERGFCDAFMVGRAAMGNPMLFSDKKPNGLAERFALLEEYAALQRKYCGNEDLKDIRLKALNLVSSVRGASVLRNRICRAKSLEAILALKDSS